MLVGKNLQEKTRNLLDSNKPFYESRLSSTRKSNRTLPYSITNLFRSRRDSIDSTASFSEYSQPSPSTSYSSSSASSPEPTSQKFKYPGERERYVLERLRSVIPDGHAKKSFFKVLINAVNDALCNDDPSFSSNDCHKHSDQFPEDLMDVDVTAFKKMISSNQVFFGESFDHMLLI